MARPKIALLIHDESGFFRSVLLGIAEYVRLHDPWDLFSPDYPMAGPVIDVSTWRGDGVIVDVRDQAIVDHLTASGMPAVNVTETAEGEALPTVALDGTQIGRLGAEHLLAQGLREFAFVAYRDNPFSARRLEGFAAALARHDYAPHLHRVMMSPDDDLAAWLQSLPKPLGLMGANDDAAYRASVACASVGIRVPEQVAIVGVDNDPFRCTFGHPRLSSIDQHAERVGYEAASLLAQMMAGDRDPPRFVPLYGAELVVRESSSFVLRDPVVAAAVTHIRTHVARPITVDEVASAVHASRRTLERLFQRTLGRSPSSEIRRAHLERAQQLLRETDRDVADVARSSGFCDTHHLDHAFRRDVGITPTAYRKQFRRK